MTEFQRCKQCGCVCERDGDKFCSIQCEEVYMAIKASEMRRTV